MENYIELIETNNGEFISASALEVTSIPKISILFEICHQKAILIQKNIVQW